MRTRTFLRGVLPLSCLALLTVWTQAGRPQPVPGQVPPLPQVDLPPTAPPVPTRPALAVVPPAAPPTATLEDLIRELETVQKQRADLESREKALVAKPRERLKDQGERLTKLGVLPQAPPSPVVVPAGDGLPVIPPADRK